VNAEYPLWVVLHQRDAEPLQASIIVDEGTARALFDNLSQGWSEVYLCRVVAGPRDVLEEHDPRRDR
jgi:hypothetical protein